MADLALKTKDEIFDLIKRTAEKLYPDSDWTGLRTGSFEWLMAQIVAEISVLNGQYLDLRANNAYLPTAIVRKDVRDIASNLGLVPTERSGATTTMSLTATDDVTVPKGTKLTTSNGDVFSTTAELVLSTSGSLSGSVIAVHSDYKSLTYRARGDSGEVVALDKDDLLVDQLIVTIDGEAWSKVDNLFGQISTSKVYRVIFDDLNRASIKFGNGVYGKRLAADSSVVVDLYFGGGPAGNSVAAASITSFLSSFTNSGNVSAITNAAAPTGGRGQDSLDDISARIPGQLRQIAGLVNKEDIAQVLKSNLSWVADATAEQGHSLVNSSYVPTIKVAAYPYATSVAGMSAAQSAELSTFLTNRGQLGVSWSSQDAYAAPVEIEVDVRLANKNLESQKTAEIKAALITNERAPFAFDQLGFNSEHKLQDILNTIESIDGIVWAKMKRFAKKPHALSVAGSSDATTPFADLSLGVEAEDGYYQVRATTSTTADTSFFRPMKVDVVGSASVKSTEANWLKEKYTIGSGSNLNDTDGPWLKPVSSKLEFKQLAKVWEADQFNGSTFDKKHFIKVSWTNVAGVAQKAYFNVADTTAPGTITTTEDADSPVSGTAISATLGSSDNSNIVVEIVEAQVWNSRLVSPQGNVLTITHNDANTLYLSSDPSGTIPVDQYSYIHFNDLPIDTTTDSWTSNNKSLRARLHVSQPFAWGDIMDLYTTPQIADRLSFNHPREVYTLDSDSITVNFI